MAGFILIGILPGCKITQEVGNNELLVNKVKLKGIEDRTLHNTSHDLIKQKPNKRLFGFWRFYLRAYNYGMRGDTSTKWRRYFRNKVGEPPVILDSAKLNTSAMQIKAYLFNHGYYDAEVTYKVLDSAKGNKKKATIIFNVAQKEPYRIANIEYGIDDRAVHFIVVNDTAQRVFKPGDIFNSDKMAEERERITQKLRNEGYYFFSKEYIAFRVDTGLQGHLVDVSIQIRNPEFYKRHQRYRIKNIYVNVVHPVFTDSADFESRWYKKDSVWVNLNGYYMNDEVLLRNILIEVGGLYKQAQVDNSYSRLNNIQLIRQTVITFTKDTVEGYLNCNINVYPGKRQEFIIEPQIISSEQNNTVEQNNQRNFGFANVAQYRNKNFFRNAETFELRYRVSIEGQFRKNDTIPFFSNLEHNITGTLNLPRIIILKRLQRSIQFRVTRSAVVSNFIYESNIDFIRRALSLGYNEIFAKQLNSFNISWAEISYNRTDAKRNFLALVNPNDSIFIANLFTTNIILGTRLTWQYNDRSISRDGRYFYSRAMIEFAGNSLRTAMKLTDQPLGADGRYKIDNVPFEQFIKIDNDFRFNKPLNEVHGMAYRLRTGVGLPYGNSTTMPFVRRYFIGGANSLRGWRPRTLGPGSYVNSLPGVRADRSGEMIIEAQAEYRFRLIPELLYGAMFLDAGNIWYTHPLQGKPGVTFGLHTFMKEMAVNTGLGLRFDFSFVVLRFDFGIPIRDPELKEGDRWLFDDYSTKERKAFRSILFNLGLGYPF